MGTNDRRAAGVLMTPSSLTRPGAGRRLGAAARVRRRIGAILEYLWELSGSVRMHRADALVIEGCERNSGLPLRILYIGHHDNFAFLVRRACSEHRVVERHDRIESVNASSWVARLQDRVDLVCVDVELFYCRPFRGGGYLEVPPWIRQKLRVGETWDQVVASFRRNTRRTDLRKVRKHGFTFRTVRGEREIEDFYHRMYVPYLRSRFDDEVIIEPEWKVRRQYRKGEILQILRDGNVVAAVLLHMADGRLAYVWVGVPEWIGSEPPDGAFSALFYFTILFGFENGCSEIDFLGSRPLLNDGLFRYKRKWGTCVSDSPVPRGDLLVRPRRLTPAVCAYLEANPFIVRDGKELVGKVFLTGERVDRTRLEGVVSDLHTPGLGRLKIFSEAGFDPGARGFAAESAFPVSTHDLGPSPDPAGDFCRF